jgi:hypothetical protein
MYIKWRNNQEEDGDESNQTDCFLIIEFFVEDECCFLTMEFFVEDESCFLIMEFFVD